MEDQQDSFEGYIRWMQLIRASSSLLICVSLWPYLQSIDDHLSPMEFVTCVVFAYLVEVGSGVVQVRLDHKKVTVLWYALSLVVGLAGGLLYLLPHLAVVWISPVITPTQYVIYGRLLIAFYTGTVTELDRSYVHLSFLRQRKSDILLSCERLRVIGSFLGALLGFGSTYIPTNTVYFQVILFPACLQVLTLVVALIWFIAAFPRFYASAGTEKEPFTTAVVITSWQERAQNTSEDNRKLIAHAKESVRHWGVFCGLIANMVLHFSTAVRDIAFPVLLSGPNESFGSVSVENLWGLRGLYGVFLAGTAAGVVGREVYRVTVARCAFDRSLMLLVLLCLGAGWVVLVPTGSADSGFELDFPRLIAGFTLVTVGTTILPESSYNIFHTVLGPLSSPFYTSVFQLIGGLGAWLGPLWTWEAIRIEAGLCFSFVTLWLGVVLAVLLAAWSEAVPYEEFMTRFVEKFPQKGKFEA